MSVYQCMLADISDVAAFLPKAVLIGILVGIVLRALPCQRTAVDRQCIVCDLCCGTSADCVFLPGAGKPVGDGYAVVWYLGNDDAGSCMGA